MTGRAGAIAVSWLLLLTLVAGCGYYGPPRRPKQSQPVVQPALESPEAGTAADDESDENRREARPPSDG